MRYALILYTHIVGLPPVIIDDVDGPNTFRHLQACISHALRVRPQFEAIMSKHTDIPDFWINWRCERIG